MTLSDISKQMRVSSPVFIIGAPRCGTSLLYITIQRQKGFRPATINLEETGIFNFINRSYEFGPPPAEKPYNFMLNDGANYQRFLKSISTIQKFHNTTDFTLNRRLSNKFRWWWSWNLNHIVLRSFFYYAGKARKCPRLIEKTPTHFKYIPKIIRAFPKAKLLFLYRHPVDVFSSYIRRGIAEKREAWTTITPERFCCDYQNAMQTVTDRYREFDGRIIWIRYEEMVQHPETVLIRVFEELGETFEPGAIYDSGDEEIEWPADPLLFKPITPVTKNWQDFVDRETARYIEDRLQAILDRCCYRRYT